MAIQQMVAILRGAESAEVLGRFLVAHSRLPGPRANLELASTFADLCALPGLPERRWEILLAWADMPLGEAPHGEASEFLPFCAHQALGAAYGRAGEPRRDQIERGLRAAAEDGRWRVREGVAMGLQRIGEADFEALRRIVDGWLQEPSLLVQRAIVAALAHPPLLRDVQCTRYCLRVADEVFLALLRAKESECDPESLRVLGKAMEYAPSVYVAWLPEEGFPLLERWADRGEPLAARIVRANSGKARLSKRFPERVASLLARLN